MSSPTKNSDSVAQRDANYALIRRFGQMGRRVAMRRASCSAFSLVEVVIAVGIIAFAFIPMVGLLPAGLDLSRQAIDTTIEAQIAQQLATEVQQTDFSRLADLAQASTANPYYFDDQGNKVPDASSAIYQAVFAIATTTNLPGDVSTGKLATVTLCILNTKAGRNSKEPDLTKNPDSKKIITLVPDNGR